MQPRHAHHRRPQADQRERFLEGRERASEHPLEVLEHHRRLDVGLLVFPLEESPGLAPQHDHSLPLCVAHARTAERRATFDRLKEAKIGGDALQSSAEHGAANELRVAATFELTIVFR